MCAARAHANSSPLCDRRNAARSGAAASSCVRAPARRCGTASAQDRGMSSPDFARILVPTDFSATSDGALLFAKRLAVKFHATLHVVHVLNDLPVAELASTQRMIDAQVTPLEREQFSAMTALLRGPVA